jgi:prepilin-type N-terminal cleavage/methylation domain-containing protein
MMRGNSGFSIYELMVVIAIIAALSAIAVPNLISHRNRAKLGDGTRALYSSFQLAKSRAARGNNNVTLTFAPNGALGRNYSLFIDDGAGTPDTSPADGIPDGANDGIVNGAETVFMDEQLPVGVNIDATTFANNAVTFGGNGIPNGVGSVDISNTAGDTRSLFLSIAGRVRIQY